MIAHSFFIGWATVLFETAASATFLTRWSASDLPLVYIVSAVLNTACGLGYARLRTRVRFGGLMSGTLWALFVVVLGIRSAQAFTSGAIVAFAALVAYRLISSLTDLEYWAVASRVFDIGQARRLFGVVGTGEVVARATGAFCVPLLVRAGGVNNLMLCSAGALGCALLVLREVLRHDTGVAPSRPEESHGSATGGRYLALVIAVALLATFGKYFVDFAFLEHLGRLGKSETELATLLGVVAGVTQTISLLLRLFVSRRFLARFGVRAGVLVLPVAQAICTLLVIGSGWLGHATAVLAFVVINQGLYKALKHPIDNASFKVLYQPIALAQRLAAQISVEVVYTPIVVALSAGAMLLFVHHYDDVRFGYLLLAVFAAWTITARVAGREYARKLVEALRPSKAPKLVSTPPAADTNLRDALHEETRRCLLLRDPAQVAESRARVLFLLSQLYDADAIHRVGAHLAHPSREKRALARELLDVVLRREDRAVLTCLTTPPPT